MLPGLLIIVFLVYSYFDRSDDKAILRGGKNWEYYDSAPFNQNNLIKEIGPHVEMYYIGDDDDNNAKKDRAEWLIKESCKKYKIENFIAVVDEVSRSGKISCTSANIKFELSTSNDMRNTVLNISDGELIKFSGKKTGYDTEILFTDVWGVIDVDLSKLEKL